MTRPPQFRYAQIVRKYSAGLTCSLGSHGKVQTRTLMTLGLHTISRTSANERKDAGAMVWMQKTQGRRPDARCD